MHLQLTASLIIGLLTAQAGWPYETDQFSNRLEPIEDATELLDAKVNATIERIVAGWHGPRDEWKFVNAIYHAIGGHHWVDKIERWAMKSPDVDRLQTPRRQSIYQGHPFWATRVAGIFGVGPTIKVNGELIGADKLGHFLSQGRKFYRRYLKSLDEAQAAEHSAFTERAIFGQLTTGVYSNADLVANYEGYRFYRGLFEDGVVEGKPAILSWRDGHWVVQRAFSWADHVNAYWDEALNVNHFDDVLYPRPLPSDIAITSVEIEGAPETEKPRLVLLPTGELSVFTVTLSRGKTRWNVKGELTGEITAQITPLPGKV